MLVLIDKDSIKKNPNAGRTTTTIPGDKTVSFEINGPLPDHLVDGKNIRIDKEALDGFFYAGRLINPEDIDILKGIPGLSASVEQYWIPIDHLPEPTYYYSYENPAIPCNNCGKSILLNSIEERDGGMDGEYTYTICPHCGEVDTFEIVYESIKEALKRV